jgi:endogenous inhibitor of DNA gyrase (YacG/DUF329 family)
MKGRHTVKSDSQSFSNAEESAQFAETGDLPRCSHRCRTGDLGVSAKLVRRIADGQNANSAARRQGITGEVHSWFERNNSRPSYLFLVFLSLLLSFARIVFL